MRRIYTIRLKSMNAWKALKKLSAMRPVHATVDHAVETQVRELYFGPTELPARRGEALRAMRAPIAQEQEEC
jgi:hypothetical protein